MKIIFENFIQTIIADHKGRIFRAFLFYGIILFVVLVSYYYVSKNIDLKLAFDGFGPHDYVSQKMNPENYIKNTPNFIGTYDNSLVTYSYYFLKKYLNVDVSLSVQLIMLLQSFLFAGACVFLINTLFNSRLLSIFSLLIIMLSGAAGLDLARFGYGYASFLTFPLYYSSAIALGLFAISLYLLEKNFLCFVCLSLAMLVHQNISLFFFAFIMMYIFCDINILKNKWFLSGVGLYSAVLIFHTYQTVVKYNVSIDGMPFEKWHELTRIFCMHWYPFVWNAFSETSFKYFLPSLIILFSFFISLNAVNLSLLKNKKIIMGMLACFLMSVAGVIVSEYVPSATLIKISIHRASGIATFIAVVFILHYLFRKIKDGGIVEKILAVICTVSMFVSSPGISVLPIICLSIVDLKCGKFGPIVLGNYRLKKIFMAVVYILLIALTCISLMNIANLDFLSAVSKSSLSFLKYFNPSAKIDYLIKGGSLIDSKVLYVLLAVGVSMIVSYKIKITDGRKYILFMIPIIMFCFIKSYSINYYKWHNSEYSQSKDFYDAQIWSKNNTGNESLFMIDPSHCYGWRDFSQRSSLGNIREWLWFPIAYVFDSKAFENGSMLSSDFGVDIEKYLKSNQKKDAKMYTEIRNIVGKEFYKFSEESLKQLCLKYSADYIVMENKKITNDYRFIIVYQNNTYRIYKTVN